MSPVVYLSRVSETLELDAAGQVPDAWLRWDVLAQGLLSRYLARAQGAPKPSTQTSPWVILRPFEPEHSRFYGVWNSKAPLDRDQLQVLTSMTVSCRVDSAAFSETELKLIRSLWNETQEWHP
jgi:hypothetical protein